jgi:hypothetical protein
MLEQLDKQTREDLYRFLAELLWHELHDAQQNEEARGASACEVGPTDVRGRGSAEATGARRVPRLPSARR